MLLLTLYKRVPVYVEEFFSIHIALKSHVLNKERCRNDSIILLTSTVFELNSICWLSTLSNEATFSDRGCDCFGQNVNACCIFETLLVLSLVDFQPER